MAEMTTPAPLRDLPPLIQRAISRVNDPDFPVILSPTQRWAFSVLLRRVSKSDGTEMFWVKRSNFAALLGASEPTVYRLLSALERHGLIERVAQKRDSDGEFTVGELRLSQWSVRTLGLELNANTDTTYKGSSIVSKMIDGLYVNQEEKQFSSKRQLTGKPFCNKTPIPEDLVWLTQAGLTHPQVFKLMGEARKHGKRLSDIAAVIRSATSGITGHRLYAYVLKICHIEKDFSAINKAKEERRALELEKTETQAFIASALQDNRNKWFSHDAHFFYLIDTSGFVWLHKTIGSELLEVGVISGKARADFLKDVGQGMIQNVARPPARAHAVL